MDDEEKKKKIDDNVKKDHCYGNVQYKKYWVSGN